MHPTPTIGGLSPETLVKLRGVLNAESGVQQILLFGSRAKKTYRDSSDIDLALKGSRLSFSRLMNLKTAIDELMLPYQVDLVVYETLENTDLKEHIDRAGIPI
ncbi:MAG: nucleotidyltransferase domain-containing protein [Deltaproteobacteria bacterium]|jgi:uncharacterized protein|nr:nucleotidyltransferase domain-containing protein [Deltaproteobacteria bacterium]MBT7205139.1 nucleotidyltransferase domain-containing protein [Deltaproteobacteria bacterium]